MAIHKRLRDKYNVHDEADLLAVLYRDSTDSMQEWANKGFTGITQQEVADYRKHLAEMIEQAFGINPIAALEEKMRKIREQVDKELEKEE